MYYLWVLGDYTLCGCLNCCVFGDYTLCGCLNCCWRLYITIYVFKCRDLRGNRKNSGYTTSLPSAGSRQSALPSACCWQRGHVAPSCAIWQQLGDHIGHYAVCLRQSRRQSRWLCRLLPDGEDMTPPGGRE